MAARIYQVEILSVVNDQVSREDARFQTADADEALAWADGFNRAELSNPTGTWATVRDSRPGVTDTLRG